MNQDQNWQVGDEIFIEHLCQRSMDVIRIEGIITKIGHPAKVRIDTENQKNIVVYISDLKPI